MIDFSAVQIEQIRMLEQLCKNFDGSNLRIGVESLKTDGGDYAFLCHRRDQLIGFISWYTSDEIEANINGMVHPNPGREIIYYTQMSLSVLLISLCTNSHRSA